MSTTPREVGTLIVVVLKANHLPNKRHIGKQDPYCLVTVNNEKRRTKAIKRGGQHPEWDEEIRFAIFEHGDDIMRRTGGGDGTPPPPPPKDSKGPMKIQGGTIMKLACYADDPREPELIGETDVDLTEVLTKGETDEWFTLTSKDKFAGKVYLELTFWSNEPPPEKKATSKPPKGNKEYAGRGSFIPARDLPSTLTPGGSPSTRMSSSSGIYDHSRQSSDTVPSSLREVAKHDLYVAPYEQRSYSTQMNNITNEFGEFGVSDPHRRRESFPPVQPGYRVPSVAGMSMVQHGNHPYEQSVSDVASAYSYDRPLTPPEHSSIHHRNSLSSAHSSFSAHTPYQPQYETGATTYHQVPARGPRHSIPTASSGFMPLSNPSGFIPPSPHPPDGTTFSPPMTHTPSPIGYNPSHFHQPSYPPPSQTPLPMHSAPYLPPSSTGPFQPQHSFPSQSLGYSAYPPPPSTSAPPQQYIASQHLAFAPPQTHSAPPQTYANYQSVPSPQEIPSMMSPATPAPAAPLMTLTQSASSRPLPQEPQMLYTQPSLQTSHTLPQQSSPQQAVLPVNNTYSSVPPPPPPPPPLQYTQPQYPVNSQQTSVVPPPPPPPLQQGTAAPPRRHASLPQPPMSYQNLIPPPPPPDFVPHNQLPPPPPPPLPSLPDSQGQNYHSNPLPLPPPQIAEQSQWQPSANSQIMQSTYLSQGFA